MGYALQAKAVLVWQWDSGSASIIVCLTEAYGPNLLLCLRLLLCVRFGILRRQGQS